MKKIAILAGVFFSIILVGIIFISNANELDTDITKNKTKVGVILNGEKEDHSWGQSHVEGLEAIAEELNLYMIYEECVPENEACIPVIEDLIAQDCKIIICDSFNYEEYEYPISIEHPEVYFFHATGLQSSKNYTSYFGRIYQMRYLTGIVAGLQTTSNEIGYVAAMDIPEVNRGINAFTIGVRSVNPKASVYVAWTNDWNSDDAAEAAMQRLMDAHNIDVVAMHTDSLKVLEIAEERGIWSIGYNIDNSKLFPNTFLTAPIWHWENFYGPHILECLQGKFFGAHYWEGIESQMIDIAPLTANVNEKARAIVDTEMNRLKSGVFDVFYGPVVDREGKIRAEEGENLSDEVLLQKFDWYVEGVIIDE